jgi:hypothetical protein
VRPHGHDLSPQVLAFLQATGPAGLDRGDAQLAVLGGEAGDLALAG